MTQYFSFVEQPNRPFTFNPVMDNSNYTGVVTWNIFGLRFYLTLLNPDGTRLFTKAVVGSPIGFDIESIEWETGTVTITTAQPHGLIVGTTLDLAVRGCVPDAYNGMDVEMLVTDDDTLTYLLQANPGAATALGKVFHDVDISGGYFTTSTLVFREDSQQFEVNP